jgi:hypothetical protein
VASRVAVGRDGFTAGFLRLISPEDAWAAAWTIGRDGQTLGYSLFVTHKRTLPFTFTVGPG